jgi:sarco/endoplasmic reticulum calcium-translocating P-type ATPase
MSVKEAFLKKNGWESEIHNGLSDKEAGRKLQEHGPNTLIGKKRISLFKIFIQQFSDFMVLILLASTAISALMGEMTEAITIIAIVLLNAVLGFVQEYRTEKTLEALKGLAAPTAKVVRSGRPVTIPAEQVVPGELVILESGDRVPADAVVIESSNLQVDESLLTGESIPVEKSVSGNIKMISDKRSKTSSVFMGTIVTGGRAKVLVYATGMNTEMGNIAGLIQNIEEDETPLQKRLDHLGKLIVAGCLTICTIVTVTGILRGEELFNMLLAGISLAVAAVPEGLPAIVTIALALGVRRMLRRNALIRKLPAVETLGCASVICSDKTGTLTENRMTVRKVFAGGRFYDIKAEGNREGVFNDISGKVDPMKQNILRLALEIGALCNNATINKGKKTNEAWDVSGDPTEAALLIAAAKGGLTPEKLDDTFFRIDELPFDSDRKCMSVVCDDHNGETWVFTKGAPDAIINKCTKRYTAKGIAELTPASKLEILRTNDSMAEEALRVLGMACKKLGTRSFRHADLEKELIFVGLAGMIDPPRREALDAVRKSKLAGIRPVMITGDHKLTATAIAKELDIYTKGDKVLTGEELDKMDESKLEKVADNVTVFARVSPKHKLMIVRVLKKLGHIVAMTGDGVNDAPAVKEADIGVSMGKTGTDVTKEASAMVLMDDNFATIVAAIEEGRVIYNNIRKFIRYMLACNIGEVLTMFLGMLVGLPIPLMPIQILWVNLVTDGLPAVALGFDPPGKDIMMRPPRGSKESIFSHGLLRLILFRGVLIGLTTLGVFVSILYIGNSLEAARTGAFATLVITQLIHVFECKSERKSIFEIPIFNNKYLIFAVLCSLIMIFGVLYIPFFQVIFNTVPLSLTEWTIIAGMCFFGPVLASFFRIGKK